MSFGELLDSFAGMPALVVGDLMLDEYHFGQATRISPEAPVMVIRHERTSHLPGGAANVALNMMAMGARPTLVGVAGFDAAGDELEACLAGSGLPAPLLVRAAGRRTTKKTRVVADHSHQVLRMDSEDDAALNSEAEGELCRTLETAMDRAKVVVLSDYLKGVLTPRVALCAMEAASARGIPVIVNPKPKSLAQYRGASLISLNRLEASQALDESVSSENAQEAASRLREKLDSPILLTLGEAGMAAAGDEEFRIPAPKVEVYDTAGAGDTVIATAALGLAATGFNKEVFELAAQMAACVVRHVGVATPSEQDMEAIRLL